eukprot:gene12587-9004_t
MEAATGLFAVGDIELGASSLGGAGRGAGRLRDGGDLYGPGLAGPSFSDSGWPATSQRTVAFNTALAQGQQTFTTLLTTIQCSLQLDSQSTATDTCEASEPLVNPRGLHCAARGDQLRRVTTAEPTERRRVGRDAGAVVRSVVRATWATDSVASVRVSCLGEEPTLPCLSHRHGQVNTGGIPPDVGHRDGPPVGARLASSALGSAQELAAALGNDDAFAATVVTRLADKASLLSELDAELEAAQDVRIAAAPETGGYVVPSLQVAALATWSIVHKGNGLIEGDVQLGDSAADALAVGGCYKARSARAALGGAWRRARTWARGWRGSTREWRAWRALRRSQAPRLWASARWRRAGGWWARRRGRDRDPPGEIATAPQEEQSATAATLANKTLDDGAGRQGGRCGDGGPLGRPDRRGDEDVQRAACAGDPGVDRVELMGVQLVAAISWTDAGPRSTPATVRGAPLTVDRGHLTAADLLSQSLVGLTGCWQALTGPGQRICTAGAPIPDARRAEPVDKPRYATATKSFPPDGEADSEGGVDSAASVPSRATPSRSTPASPSSSPAAPSSSAAPVAASLTVPGCSAAPWVARPSPSSLCATTDCPELNPRPPPAAAVLQSSGQKEGLGLGARQCPEPLAGTGTPPTGKGGYTPP